MQFRFGDHLIDARFLLREYKPLGGGAPWSSAFAGLPDPSCRQPAPRIPERGKLFFSGLHLAVDEAMGGGR